jgi:hypothetical protein
MVIHRPSFVLLIATGSKAPLKSALAPGLRTGLVQNEHDAASSAVAKVEITPKTEAESPVPRSSPPRIHSDMHFDSTASSSSSASAQQPLSKFEDDFAPTQVPAAMDVDKGEARDTQTKTASIENDQSAAEQATEYAGEEAPRPTDGGDETPILVKEEERVE